MKLAALALLFFFALSALAARDQLAPLHTAEDAARIEGEYLVLFNEALTRPLFETQAAALQSALEAAGDGSELKRTMTVGDKFRALHLKLSPKTLTAVRSHPSVVLVEENQVVQVNQEECNVQNDVIWNLGRISTHDIDLVDDGYKYSYDGEDVDVYIIDTGILTTHEEFAGRAEFGANFAGGSDADCNGHGTHVAGTVAGELYGVAKKATVIAVKVLDCAGSGSYDGVIQGISWTATEAKKRGRPSAANMSLGGGKSAIVNSAVAAAVDAGVTFVVAAGNENTDACLRSPASEPKAVTVAATTIVTTTTGKTEDRRASFSNFGKCVDIAAPGQLIKAAWIDKAGYAPNTVTNIISGTSMASPHVAGVAALVLSQYPDATPAEVEAAIYSVVTEGAIDLACPSVGSACAGTPNRLLYASC